MHRFIETIRIENGNAENLERHNERMNRTRSMFFGECVPIDLRHHIQPERQTIGIVKCRIVYDTDITDISYAPYRMRPVSSLRLIDADHAEYSHKYADRSVLENLYNRKGNADDVLLVRDGMLTDTSIANIALFDETKWYTPASPMLKGTRRASLLAQSLIEERNITEEELLSYTEITLFNAMIPFGVIRFSVDRQHIFR